MRLASRIQVLERNGRYILFNPAFIMPLYLPEGGRNVLKLLQSLENGDGSHLIDIFPEDLLDLFLEHSLIVPCDVESDKELCQCDCNSNARPSRRCLYLLLSQSCNQACVYCYNGKETYRTNCSLTMNRDTAFEAIRQTVRRIADGGELEVVLFGGEPLLNWPLAKDVIDFCQADIRSAFPSITCRYHLTTNLTIFPDDLISVAQMHDITFLVDIDGPPEIHNVTRPYRTGAASLDDTVGNIARLRAAGIDVALRATVTSHNHDRLVEVAEFHRDIGGSSSAFVPLNAVDSDGTTMPFDLCPSPKLYAQGLRDLYHSSIWPVERLFPFSEFLGRLSPGYRNSLGCGAPYGNTPVVSTEGGVFSCIYLVNIPEFEVGNLAMKDFPRQDVLDRMKTVVHVDNRPDCAVCGFRYLCGGGCPVGMFGIANNPAAPDHVKRYTHEIACATALTVMTELFWACAEGFELTRAEVPPGLVLPTCG